MQIYKYNGNTVKKSDNYLELLFKDGSNLITYPAHLTRYRKSLLNENEAESTIEIYLKTIEGFYKEYGYITKENLILWKDRMITVKKYKPRTINQRINAVNKYLRFIDLSNYHLKTIRIPDCNFIDNAVSLRDYHRLQKKLLEDGNTRLYLIVTVLGTTGLRVSELTRLNIIDIKTDGFRVYSKRDRMRLIYFPPKVQKELIAWAKSEGRYDLDDDEPLFLNRCGLRIDPRTIQSQLKRYGTKCHIQKLHPHALRHMFALSWLDRMSRLKGKGKIEYGVLPMLSQILGHQSLETTMIYLKPGAEQIKWYAQHIDW